MKLKATNASRTNRFRKRDKKMKRKILLRKQPDTIQDFIWANLKFCCSKNCLRNMFADPDDSWTIDVNSGQKYFDDLRSSTLPRHFTDAERDERGFSIFKETLIDCGNEDMRCSHSFELKLDGNTHKCCRNAWAYAYGITRNKMNSYAKRAKDHSHEFLTQRTRKINEGFVGESYSSLESTFWNNCLDESHQLSFSAGNVVI